jgi:hypothetical protein
VKNPGGGIKRKYSSTLDDLVKVIGLPAMVFLARSYGGRALRIPSEALPDAPLTMAIGEKAALQICAQYRGEYLNIPAESTVMMQYQEQINALRAELLDFRNTLIRREVAAGGKILRVALRYRLSRPMIRKIIRRSTVPLLPSDARQ